MNAANRSELACRRLRSERVAYPRTTPQATNPPLPRTPRAINQKLRKAIESEGRVERIEGLWWQFSLTARGPQEPSA